VTSVSYAKLCGRVWWYFPCSDWDCCLKLMLQIRPENLGFAIELEKLQDTIQNFKEWVIVEYFTNILEQ